MAQTLNIQEQVVEQAPVEAPAGPSRDEKGRILPGHSGNIRGRPPKAEMAAQLRAFLRRETDVSITKADGTKDSIKMSRLLVLWGGQFEKAVKGDAASARLLIEFGFGKPDQTVTLGGTIHTPSGLPPAEEAAIAEKIKGMSVDEIREFINERRQTAARLAVVGGLAGAEDAEEEGV